MANINDPQAVKFVNEKVRTEADNLRKTFDEAIKLLAVHKAKGFDKLIPPTMDLIEDGSPADGRTPITGLYVNILLKGLESMVNQSQAVNPDTGLSLIDVITAIAVNY